MLNFLIGLVVGFCIRTAIDFDEDNNQ